MNFFIKKCDWTIYIPTSNVWGFQFLHTLINTCYCLSLYYSCRGVCFWFAFSWWLTMLNIFPCAYWPFIYLLWEMSFQILYPVFNWVICLLLLSLDILYILLYINRCNISIYIITSPLSDIYICKHFLPLCGLVFSHSW